MILRHPLFLTVVVVFGAALAVLPAATNTMPLEEVRAGMRGTGVTVFQGMERSEFTAEIIGVLENSVGVRRNLILARLEGGPLAVSGVIQGMSGSPVYIDGRLIGAVSYSMGSFPKDTIAGAGRAAAGTAAGLPKTADLTTGAETSGRAGSRGQAALPAMTAGGRLRARRDLEALTPVAARWGRAGGLSGSSWCGIAPVRSTPSCHACVAATWSSAAAFWLC